MFHFQSNDDWPTDFPRPGQSGLVDRPAGCLRPAILNVMSYYKFHFVIHPKSNDDWPTGRSAATPRPHPCPCPRIGPHVRYSSPANHEIVNAPYIWWWLTVTWAIVNSPSGIIVSIMFRKFLYQFFAKKYLQFHISQIRIILMIIRIIRPLSSSCRDRLCLVHHFFCRLHY